MKKNINSHPLLTGGEVGDRDGQALLGGGSSSSSSEELSSVKSITSTFLLLLWDELFLWSDTTDRHESTREEHKKQTSLNQNKSILSHYMLNTVTFKYLHILLQDWGNCITYIKYTINAIWRCWHFLYHFLGSHRSPIAIFFKLDLITVHTTAQNLHEQPVQKKENPLGKNNFGKTSILTAHTAVQRLRVSMIFFCLFWKKIILS